MCPWHLGLVCLVWGCCSSSSQQQAATTASEVTSKAEVDHDPFHTHTRRSYTILSYNTFIETHFWMCLCAFVFVSIAPSTLLRPLSKLCLFPLPFTSIHSTTYKYKYTPFFLLHVLINSPFSPSSSQLPPHLFSIYIYTFHQHTHAHTHPHAHTHKHSPRHND